MHRALLAIGAFAMALGVVLGAVSAHATHGAAHPDAAHLLTAAVTYHLVHGLALVIEGAMWRAWPSRWLLAAYVLHAAGLVLFCGGMWILAMTGASLGPVVPSGGLAFIAGWIALAVYACRMPRG
ncbi:MAG TPA: DUF423 domain-containing protein [Usitatibacter sp.]|nr:DUF423 domain-containing protein [Usitatibacter sp.]